MTYLSTILTCKYYRTVCELLGMMDNDVVQPPPLPLSTPSLTPTKFASHTNLLYTTSLLLYGQTYIYQLNLGCKMKLILRIFWGSMCQPFNIDNPPVLSINSICGNQLTEYSQFSLLMHHSRAPICISARDPR